MFCSTVYFQKLLKREYQIFRIDDRDTDMFFPLFPSFKEEATQFNPISNQPYVPVLRIANAKFDLYLFFFLGVANIFYHC